MKHPKQLRVTLKEQCEPGAQDGMLQLPPLGFAHAYEPHLKTFAKKQETQDKWAYEPYFGFMFYKDGRVYRTTQKWVYEAGRHGVLVDDETIEIPENLQPRVIDNVPLEGFCVQRSVSRYSTSNKLWRILDPRGFELEITTACFEDLVMSCVIDKGVIMAPCIWHTGKVLVVA